MNPHQQGHAGGWMKSSVSQSFLNAKLPFGFVHKQQVFTAALKKNKKTIPWKSTFCSVKIKQWNKQEEKDTHRQTETGESLNLFTVNVAAVWDPAGKQKQCLSMQINQQLKNIRKYIKVEQRLYLRSRDWQWRWDRSFFFHFKFLLWHLFVAVTWDFLDVKYVPRKRCCRKCWEKKLDFLRQTRFAKCY